MIKTPKTMLEIYTGEYGYLFEGKEPKNIAKTTDDRLLESFEEINDFYRKNSCAPRKDSADFNEQKLAWRLLNLRNSPEKREYLHEFDEFGLLDLPKKPASLEELFASSEGDIFASDIFDTSKLPKIKTQQFKGTPDRRVAIENFADSYENLFKEQHLLLSTGQKKLKPFTKENQLRAGSFYIYGGIMCYVESISDPVRMAGGHFQERTVTIFENGTKSHMFRRSLRQRLKDGTGFEIIDGEAPAGYIYVLKSLSPKDEIQTIKDLYKIGFTAGTVEDRIRGAENDPTYLMAAVEVVATYAVSAQINPQKIEHIIHRFFKNSKVLMTIIDNSHKPYTPDEWYSVPLDIVDSAMSLLATGEIENYYYDRDSQSIVKI